MQMIVFRARQIPERAIIPENGFNAEARRSQSFMENFLRVSQRLCGFAKSENVFGRIGFASPGRYRIDRKENGSYPIQTF